MKEVYVVGEDPVTKEIVSRIIRDYAPNLYIKGYLPARGGEIKKKMENFNAFSLSYPVVLLWMRMIALRWQKIILRKGCLHKTVAS